MDTPRPTLFNGSVGVSYPEHAADYLDARELAERLEEAKLRIIRIIRFNDIVLAGKGYCHEVTSADMREEPGVRGTPSDPATLALFIHERDKRRPDAAYKQRKDADIRLIQNKIRMPQNLRRRRSALFGGQDMEINIFEVYPLTYDQLKELVEVIRYNLMVDAVKALVKSQDLAYIDGVWMLKVSTADAQRLAMMDRNTNRVKDDDRHWHGRPRRDRGRNVRLP